MKINHKDDNKLFYLAGGMRDVMSFICWTILVVLGGMSDGEATVDIDETVDGIGDLVDKAVETTEVFNLFPTFSAPDIFIILHVRNNHVIVKAIILWIIWNVFANVVWGELLQHVMVCVDKVM